MTHGHLPLVLGAGNGTPSSARIAMPGAPRPPALPPSPLNMQQYQAAHAHYPSGSIPNEPSQATSSNICQRVQNIMVAPPSSDPILDDQPLPIVAPACQPAPEAPQSEREAQWLAEIARLRSLLDLNTSAANHPPAPSGRILFDSPESVDQIRSAIIASKDTKKKIVLPEVIPGFKAASTDFSSLHLLIFILFYFIFIIPDMVIDLSRMFIR